MRLWAAVDAAVRAFPDALPAPLSMRAVVAASLGLVRPGANLGEALGERLEERLAMPPAWLALPEGALRASGPAVREASEALAATEIVADASALAERLGALHERWLSGEPARGSSWLRVGARRRTGAHLTSAALARGVVARTFDPLLTGPRDAIAFVDPTMGAGIFLAEAIAHLAARAWASPREASASAHGVDVDPLAVDVARVVVLHAGGGGAELARSVEQRLRVGDAALGPLFEGGGVVDLEGAFSWRDAFPEVARRGGFDAVVGNPPWIAYAGRAAQPLTPARRAALEAESAAFARYRTLHGVLVERAARLARPGGRVGLVVPTSMADLEGYQPARAAHDAWAEAERDLVDLGARAFPGVFQPAMVLTSVRRARSEAREGAPWRLARPELDPEIAAWLETLAAWPTLPREAFAERGVQTSSADKHLVRRSADGGGPLLRAGGDIAPFSLGAPSFALDPAHPAVLRPRSWWAFPGVLVRQTARFPIAALSDGVAFRNSILAGLPTPLLGAPALAAYLNSSLVRFAHYQRFRDARQGMPQLKIAHLRATPWPPAAGALARELEAAGEELVRRDEGVTPAMQERLDALVAGAWRAPPGIADRVRAWALAHPPPAPRAR